jgi:hypothetical protein
VLYSSAPPASLPIQPGVINGYVASEGSREIPRSEPSTREGSGVGANGRNQPAAARSATPSLLKTEIARNSPQHLPEINVHVTTRGESAQVRVRDFRASQQDIQELVKRIIGLVSVSGLELEGLIINGRNYTGK